MGAMQPIRFQEKLSLRQRAAVKVTLLQALLQGTSKQKPCLLLELLASVLLWCRIHCAGRCT